MIFMGAGAFVFGTAIRNDGNRAATRAAPRTDLLLRAGR
jgi:hypothetical protein